MLGMSSISLSFCDKSSDWYKQKKLIKYTLRIFQLKCFATTLIDPKIFQLIKKKKNLERVSSFDCLSDGTPKAVATQAQRRRSPKNGIFQNQLLRFF